MDLVCIRKYLNRHEAEIDHALLTSCGFAAVINADDAGGMNPHLNWGQTGVQLLVNPADAHEATSLLNAPPEPELRQGN